MGGQRRQRRWAGRYGPRALFVSFVAVAVTLGAPGAAQAHDTTLPDTAYYRSTVDSISPAVPGLKVTIDRAGESVTLVNDTGSEVDVPGYSGEPYLRFTAAGVEQNTNSLSAFLNGSLVIAGLPQQLGTPQQPPSWKHVADLSAFTWHDHRTHWMAQQRPPVVAADPTRPHPVFDWTIPMTVSGTAVTVRGSLRWIGEPPLAGWLVPLYVVAATLVIGAVGILVIRVRRGIRGRVGAPAGA